MQPHDHREPPEDDRTLLTARRISPTTVELDAPRFRSAHEGGRKGKGGRKMPHRHLPRGHTEGPAARSDDNEGRVEQVGWQQLWVGFARAST
ncbi:hypothetical protein GUJ93_ZPchr0002g25664 [Zizania palustris]|uniref:Uncharacterized protein n=1 Tax=Zizania palustris TaxID=103762 RepID=A0A8J5RJ11_ZIZPA|nr:hypothetical protein GUJ93_ZPchr0002g25664 [Zizania palustris]